jgi:hypothetical protein
MLSLGGPTLEKKAFFTSNKTLSYPRILVSHKVHLNEVLGLDFEQLALLFSSTVYFGALSFSIFWKTSFGRMSFNARCFRTK